MRKNALRASGTSQIFPGVLPSDLPFSGEGKDTYVAYRGGIGMIEGERCIDGEEGKGRNGELKRKGSSEGKGGRKVGKGKGSRASQIEDFARDG
jgi:hypothetical protein